MNSNSPDQASLPLANLPATPAEAETAYRQMDALISHVQQDHRNRSLITVFDLPDLAEGHRMLHERGDSHPLDLHHNLPADSLPAC